MVTPYHIFILIRNAMNNKTKTAVFLCLVSLSFSIQAVEVSKNDWLNAMSTALPTAFCNSVQYFRQCFTISAQECEETAASATRICLANNKDKIPEKLAQPEDGTYWGTVIGKCAGNAFEIALIKKRINNTKCNDPANWQ